MKIHEPHSIHGEGILTWASWLHTILVFVSEHIMCWVALGWENGTVWAVWLSLETRVHMSVPLLVTYVSYIKKRQQGRQWYHTNGWLRRPTGRPVASY